MISVCGLLVHGIKSENMSKNIMSEINKHKAEVIKEDIFVPWKIQQTLVYL